MINGNNFRDESGKVVCGLCGAVFEQFSCLGGHYSKAHAGKSSAYQHKMKVRQERAIERDALTKAKVVFREKLVKRLQAEGKNLQQIEVLVE